MSGSQRHRHSRNNEQAAESHDQEDKDGRGDQIPDG